MKYCTQCLQPDTRPNTYFTEDGICPACNYINQPNEVNWDERFQVLQDLVQKYRKPNAKFDCIIGVSGGKDSTRQALWAREKLGVNPLLVCLSYPPEQVTERGCDNVSNLIELGFDTVILAPAPMTWKAIVKEGFLNFTNWAKATEQAIIGSAPKLALKYDIPLILWGENPGLQLGDMATMGKTGYDGNNLRNMNTVSGGNLDWLVEAGVSEGNLLPFKLPTEREFELNNIQIVYLGWFWNDWSLVSNGLYSITHGLNIREDFVDQTGDITRVSSLDEDWVTLNQMIKYYKFGFGRVTDYVNEAIRIGVMSRDQGVSLVTRYDGSCSPKYIESFCEYIDISLDDFWIQVRSSVNKDLFSISDDGSILPRFEVGVGL